jgi:hypothetical protein
MAAPMPCSPVSTIASARSAGAFVKPQAAATARIDMSLRISCLLQVGTATPFRGMSNYMGIHDMHRTLMHGSRPV